MKTFNWHYTSIHPLADNHVVDHSRSQRAASLGFHDPLNDPMPRRRPAQTAYDEERAAFAAANPNLLSNVHA